MTQNKVVEVTDDNFAEVISNDKPVLIDFWAEWCGPCRMLGPTIEDIALETEGKFVIGKLNVDNNSATSAKFGIRSIPVVIIFQEGKEVDRIIGNASKSVILAKLEACL
jgi:thioredoxin 1